MRSLALLGIALGALGVTAGVTPLVTAALGPGFEVARVYDRLFEGLLAAALALSWRRLDLGGRAVLGLAADRPLRSLLRGLAVGLSGLTVGLLICWALGALVPMLRYPPAKTVGKATLGLGAALAIGVGEEGLFRGVLLRRAALDLGGRTGVGVVTAVYALVHVLRTGGRHLVVGPGVGWDRTFGLLAPLADPTTWPSALGLAGLGFLLAWCRLRTGSLWMGVGIHAGWVAVFRVGRLVFDLRRSPAWLVGPGWPPLIGGAAGWIALLVTGILAIWLLRSVRPVVGDLP